jgi:hypothetical protein
MFAAHIPKQDPEHIRAIFVLITIGVVVFWRTAIKFLAIAVILLFIWGAVTLLQLLH